MFKEFWVKVSPIPATLLVLHMHHTYDQVTIQHNSLLFLVKNNLDLVPYNACFPLT